METLEIHTQLQEKWMIFWWALGIGLLIFISAWRRGLFKPCQASSLLVIRGIDVLKGFGFFLFAELLLVPALAEVGLTLAGYDLAHLTLSPETKGWLNFLVILGGFVGVLFVYLSLTSLQRRYLWQQNSLPWYHHIKVGIVVWVISYPFVMAFSQLISIGIWHLFHHPFIEQTAVQNIRQTLVNPWVFGLMAFAVVILVPFTEEFLFRGLLQSWLKHKLNHTAAAIVLSSCLFTGFHYSSSQGVGNIELLSSLFMLSCILGLIYERQRSLWAPIGLHGFFNLISLLLIVKEP